MMPNPLIATRRLVLAVLLGCTPVFAQTQPSFEVATIKPIDPNAVLRMVGVSTTDNGIDAQNVTLPLLIRSAYGRTKFLLDEQITGVPAWAETEKYNVMAKMSDADVVVFKSLSPEQQRDRINLMIQSLLAERFHLKIHTTTKQVSAYSLTVGKGGPKVQPIKGGDTPLHKDRNGNPLPGSAIYFERDGTCIVQDYTMANFAGFLTQQAAEIGNLIVDQTGLAGHYSFKLDWSPSRSMKLAHPDPGTTPEESRPLITVLQQDLGLQLQKTNVTVDVIVIDHAEKATDN